MNLRSLVGALVLLLGTYSGYWYYLFYYAEDYVQQRAEDLAASGIDFTYRDLQVSGFPYRLVLDFEAASFRSVQGETELDWRAKSLQVITQPWNFRHLILFSGSSEFGASPRGESDDRIVLRPAFLQASFRTDSADTTTMSFDLQDAAVCPAKAAAPSLTSQRASFHIKLFAHGQALTEGEGLVEEKRADIYVAMEGLQVARLTGVEGANLTIRLAPRGPFLPRLTGYSLGEWRDAGSTLEIEDARLRAGSTVVWGEGSLSLDDQLRPLGAVSLSTNNPDTLLDWLAAHGLIEGNDLALTKQAIRTLHAMMNSGNDFVVPISLQEGQLSVGPIPVLELKPLITSN